MSPLHRYIEDHFFTPELPLDENHPLFNEEQCHLFSESNVLVEGVPQAQVLTKTLVVKGLPERIQQIVESTELTPETDLYMKNAILNAHLFDAEQSKLPKKKNDEKPMWNFARDYGISAARKSYVLINYK